MSGNVRVKNCMHPDISGHTPLGVSRCPVRCPVGCPCPCKKMQAGFTMVDTGPTPERRKKAGRDFDILTDDQGWAMTFRMDDAPIAVLMRRGRKKPKEGISGLQFQAGAQYHAMAYEAGILASGVPDLSQERVDGGMRVDISVRRLEAQQRFNDALKQLTPQSKHILSDIVLSEAPLNIYADRFRSFPQPRERRAIALQKLREALDELIEIFGMWRRATGIQRAGTDDYRPAIPLPDQSRET